MSTMYSRSKIMFEQSVMALGNVAEDDAYLDIACFETQQAIEFLLKAVLLEEGVVYGKTNHIGQLLELVLGTGFTFEKQDVLELLSDTITDWEESSRYGKGIRTTVQTVQRVHNIYRNINEEFLRRQAENNK